MLHLICVTYVTLCSVSTCQTWNFKGYCLHLLYIYIYNGECLFRKCGKMKNATFTRNTRTIFQAFSAITEQNQTIPTCLSTLFCCFSRVRPYDTNTKQSKIIFHTDSGSYQEVIFWIWSKSEESHFSGLWSPYRPYRILQNFEIYI